MIRGVAEKSFFRKKMYPQMVFTLIYTLLMQSYGMAQPAPHRPDVRTAGISGKNNDCG